MATIDTRTPRLNLPVPVVTNALKDDCPRLVEAFTTLDGAVAGNIDNLREQWRRQLAEVGLTLVDGSFEEGATANSATDAVWHIAGGQCYTWGGEFPKTVAAGSTPETAGGIGLGAWVSVGDAALRSELASEKGALHIGNFASSSGVISAKLYGVVSGVDCSSIIQGIQDLSESLRLPIDFSGIEEVVFSGMVRVGDFFHWKSNGRFNTTIKPLTLTRTALGAAYSGDYGSVYA